MGHALYSSISIALIHYLSDILTHHKKSYVRYAIVFIVTYFLMFCLYGHGDEFHPHFNYNLYKESLEEFDFCKYESAVWEHIGEAEECIAEAEQICIYMPCPADKEKAAYCLKTFIAGCVPGSPHVRITAMAVAFLTEYVPACVDQWQRLVYLVEKARYHYEMAVFYNNVLAQQGESQF